MVTGVGLHRSYRAKNASSIALAAVAIVCSLTTFTCSRMIATRHHRNGLAPKYWLISEDVTQLQHHGPKYNKHELDSKMVELDNKKKKLDKYNVSESVSRHAKLKVPQNAYPLSFRRNESCRPLT